MVKDLNWDSWIKHPYATDEQSLKLGKVISDFFKKLKINTRKMTMLEIGAGHGIFTLILHKLFKSVLATEPNLKLFNALKKIKINNIKVMQASAEELNIQQKVDMIVCMKSFEFIKNKKQILLKFNTLLKSKGYLLICEPIAFLHYNSPNNKLMFDTSQAITKSKKFKIIHQGTFGYLLCYLLRKV
jgi:2-polyprenyl-3-methyl-5-hydroxy-6-metoxy-1,4-benzoquinol methylase